MKTPVHWGQVFTIIWLLFSNDVTAEDSYSSQRHTLIATIVTETATARNILDHDSLDQKVIDAMLKVPRHEFVRELERPFAYMNRPLPIGHGQTISQPLIVAIMTDLLRLKKTDRVLEVGTGSGYQAAILAELANSVYTIEIIEPLAKWSADNLNRTGYNGVHTRTGDGYYGWEEAGPFEAIVVTAVASHIPPPLIKQLKPGGRMIIPVGAQFMTQYLVLVTKDNEQKISTRQLLPVSFVPLTGKH